MDSATKRPRLYAAMAALLTGIALYFGTGLATIPALTWLAPLPVLLLAPRVSGQLAALAAFVGWSLGLANLWHYLLKDLDLPPAAMGFLVLLAGVFTLTVVLFRALAVRMHFALAALVAPASWAACDYLIATVSPHGAFTSLAYTQADERPIVQLVSLTGVWGISFLLLAPAAAIAVMLSPGIRRRTVVQVATALVIVAIGTFGYGAWRLSADPSDQAAVRIAVVSANTDDDSNWSSPGGPTVLDNYAKQITVAAKAGAQVVLLPEKIIDVDAAALVTLQAKLQAIATSNNIQLVAGLAVFGDGGNDYNRALVLRPDGSTPTSYDKHHLIPGIEPYESGDHLGVMPGLGGGHWGVLICKDMDFPRLSRQYGRAGVGLLLVPALDFDDDGWLHSRMALLRGVENGIPLARDGSQGLLTLSDQYGRVVSEVAAPSDSAATLTGELRPGIAGTLYTRWGDWFGWLCCLFTVAGLVSLRRRT
jgi:apolipoprotein N-acyltransferase